MHLPDQSGLLQALGWAVLSSLWQMAFLWVLYQVILAVFQLRKASLKSILAFQFLFSGFVWFTLTFFTAWAKESFYSSSVLLVTIEGIFGTNSWQQAALPFLSISYLVILIVPFLNFIRNYRYVNHIRRHGLLRADPSWKVFIQNMSTKMGLRPAVRVWISELISSPVTIGFLKPIILLPLAVVNHLSTQQMEAILLHELSHIRRRDYLFNLITRIIQTILYFNPFVKAFAAIIETEREKHCDEMVLQFQYDPHEYASALLALEKASMLPQPLALGASDNRRHELLKRIELILGVKRSGTVSLRKLGLLFLTGLLFLLQHAGNTPGTSFSKENLAISEGPVVHESFTAQPLNETFRTNHAVESEYERNKPGMGNMHLQIRISHKPSTGLEIDPQHESQAEEGLQPTKGPFVFADHVEAVIPELDAEAEVRVKEAIDIARKLATREQWEKIDRDIADAMTMKEKKDLKAIYLEKMQNLDLRQLENELKLAYDQVNWNEVNTQLDLAITELKIDSITNIYNKAICKLLCLEKEMVKAKLSAIPDSDISLQSIEERRKEIIREIEDLKAGKSRKIIRL